MKCMKAAVTPLCQKTIAVLRGSPGAFDSSHLKLNESMCVLWDWKPSRVQYLSENVEVCLYVVLSRF